MTFSGLNGVRRAASLSAGALNPPLANPLGAVAYVSTLGVGLNESDALGVKALHEAAYGPLSSVGVTSVCPERRSEEYRAPKVKSRLSRRAYVASPKTARLVVSTSCFCKEDAPGGYKNESTVPGTGKTVYRS